jgi:hypothetical protein
VQPALSQQPAGPGRNDEPGVASEAVERGEVKMVVVQVRNECGIDVTRNLRTASGAPEQLDPAPQNRVGEEPSSVQLEVIRMV